MSLIGLAIIAEVAGLQIPDVNVIDSIIAVIGKFEGFVGLVALLVVLAFAKNIITVCNSQKLFWK